MNNENDSGKLQQAIASEMSSVQTTLSLSQKVLVITEDRLELHLRDGVDRLKNNSAWLPPFGIFSSSGIATLTANFKDEYLSAATWHSIFVGTSLASLAWLIVSIARWRPFGVSNLMALIRNASSKQRLQEPAMPIALSKTTVIASQASVSITTQCSQCGYAILEPADINGRRVCPSCGVIN